MGKRLKKFKDVDHVAASLVSADYICSKTIATVVYLSQATLKPVLVEGRNRVRVLERNGNPPPGFEPVAPTLEDAYLVLMRSRKRESPLAAGAGS